MCSIRTRLPPLQHPRLHRSAGKPTNCPCLFLSYASQGCYVETIHKSSGSTRSECQYDCLHNSTCKSWAFSPRYNDCIFYDHVAEDLQLYEDSDSIFEHYDLCCTLPTDY